jgi:hypothetical protein
MTERPLAVDAEHYDATTPTTSSRPDRAEALKHAHQASA